MDSDSQDIMFAHDGVRIFYPCGPGRVYAVTFAGLAEATGHDDVYRTITACGDLHMLLGARHPPECLRLDRKAPRAWVDCGNFEDDLGDAVEQWADYCDRLAAEEDGEAADLERIVGRAA